MTFDKLQKGLGKKCVCAKLGPATENTTDTFARIVKTDPPKLDSFESWSDEGKKLKPGAECKTKCKYRGLSINKIDAENETEVIEMLTERVRIKPSLGAYCYKFRILKRAGLVWHTPSQNGKNQSHHTLLRVDTFTEKDLVKVEIVELEI